MSSEQETLERILNIVRFKSKGMTITELSRHTNIHRNSIAKYLQILLASGKVDVQLIGNAKVYTISRRVPINSMLSYSSDLILIINQDKKVIQINDIFLDYFDISKEEILHKDWDDIDIPFLNLDEIKKLILKGFEEGEKSGYEILFEKDNKEYNFYINIIPVVLEGGAKGITILIKDFTNQKIAEDAMVESEEKYRNLFNYAMDAIFLYEINPKGLIGNLLEVNEVAPRKLHYGYDELLNLPAESVIIPENWDISTQMDSQLAENYNSIFEGYLVRKDSLKIPVEISSQIFELNNKLVVLFIVRDITKWKDAQNKLEISEKRYKGIVETQTELICRQYPDRVFNYVNDAFCRYFDVKRDDIIGVKDLLGLNPEDLDEINLKIKSLTPENPSVSFEFETKIKNKEIKWVQWVTLGLFDNSGEIVEYQSVGRDITAQKNAEQALRESEETARILLDESKSSALLIDSKGFILQNNLKALGLYGIKPGGDDNRYESFKGRHYTKVFSEFYHNDFDEILRVSLSKKESGSFKREYGGSIYQYSYYPIFSSTNGVSKIAIFKSDITEIKKLEADLTNSVKKLTEIIEFLPEATFAVDKKGFVIAWNNAMEKMTGIKKHDIIVRSESCSVLLFGSKKPLLVDILLKNMDGEKKGETIDDSLTATIKCDSFNGKEESYLFVKASCFYSDEGEIAGAIETIRDITEIKTTRNALEKSEQRYRAIVEEQTDMLCRIMIPEMKISFVNKALCRNFDFSEKQLIGEDISIIFPENVCNKINDYENLPCDADYTLYYETRIVENGGKTSWQEWKINPVYSHDKNIAEFQCVGRDITARKKAEIKLRESEEKYRFLIEKSKSIIIKIDNDGRIIFFNEFAEKFYGYTEKEAIGKKFAGFLTPRTESTGRDLDYLIMHVSSDPKNYSKDENENITKDGRVKWVSWSFSPIEDDGGLQEGILCVGSDITDRKTFEEINKKTRSDLSILSRSASIMSRLSGEDEFYDYISSELKNAVSYSTVLITAYSKITDSYYPRILKGDVDGYEKMLSDMFDIDLKGINFRFSDKYKDILLKREFIKSEDGFYGMFHHELPKLKCESINEIMSVGRCYTKGIVWNDKLLGTVSFVLKTGESLSDPLLFETLINQASTIIKKFTENEALIKKISDESEKLIPSSELIKKNIEKLNEKKNNYLENLVKLEKQMTKNCLNCIEKAMVGVDINGHIIQINKTGCEVLGCREETAIGKRLYNFFPEYIQDETKKIHHELTNGTNIRKMSISSEIMNDTGGNYEIVWDANRITDDFGKTISLLWVGNI